MLGEVIQEYLVALGAKVDRPGFQEMDRTIQQTSAVVNQATAGWAASFTRASAVIGSSIAGVTASIVGLMNAAAQGDLKMEMYARQMMMGRDAAEQMKRAVDALGESINDIALTPELAEGYRQLTADGSKMLVGGDFKQVMKDFRDFAFEFTRLKQEASYALTWVGYYLAKYLQKPLQEIRERFKEFNDTFIKNMSVWTEKIARAMVYILNIGRHFLEFIWDVGKALYSVWDSFPKGVKIAAGALAALWTIINASPLGRMIMLVSTLLLLIDDYYGYMEGKQAAFGKYWDILNEYIEKGKALWEEYKPVVMDALNSIAERLVEVKDVLFELGNGILETDTSQIGEFIDRFKNLPLVKEFTHTIELLCGFFELLYDAGKRVIKEVQEFFNTLNKDDDVWIFLESIGELAAAIVELQNAFLELVGTAFKEFFSGLGETDRAYSFADALRDILKVVNGLIKSITRATKKLSQFLKEMKDNHTVKEFWKGLGRVMDEFNGIVIRVLGSVGKLGQALLLLSSGKFSEAKAMAMDAFNTLKGKKGKRKNSGGADAVGEFMAAISGQESGGNYDALNTDSGAAGAFQIMPENWPSWAENAGLGADAPMTQENQNKVARHKMTEYYNQFGNWRDVAIAWYAGPGAVEYSEEAKNRKQYSNGNEYPSINEYADSVMGRLAKIQAENQSYGGGGGSLGVSSERLDPDIDASGVSLDGTRPETIAMINRANQIYKKLFGRNDFWVSCTVEGHAPGTGHANGYKADIGGSALNESYENRVKFQEALQTEGIGANNEYDYPSDGSTGPHFDLDVRGENWQTGENFGGFNITDNGGGGGDFSSNGGGGGVIPTSTGFMSTGVPMWQRIQGMARDNINLQNLVAGMSPSYAGSSGHGGGGNATLNMGDIIVNIEGASGMNEEGLAREVSRRVQSTMQDSMNYFAQSGLIGPVV